VRLKVLGVLFKNLYFAECVLCLMSPKGRKRLLKLQKNEQGVCFVHSFWVLENEIPITAGRFKWDEMRYTDLCFLSKNLSPRGFCILDLLLNTYLNVPQ